MRAGRIRRCDPARVADQLFHGLIGHWVAQAIAGDAGTARDPAEPFLVQLVEMIAAHLARELPPAPAPRRGRSGAR
jgi:hypothetical protein